MCSVLSPPSKASDYNGFIGVRMSICVLGCPFLSRTHTEGRVFLTLVHITNPFTNIRLDYFYSSKENTNIWKYFTRLDEAPKDIHI